MKCSLGISNFIEEISAAAAKSLQSSDSVRPHRWQPTRFLCPCDSSGKNTGVGCYFLLQSMHECMLSCFSHVRLCATPWTAAHQAPLSQNSLGKSTGVGCHFLLPKRFLSRSIVFLYFFALITEDGFLTSPCYPLELGIQMGMSFLFSFAFGFSSFLSYL